jgi:hypothetical protein
MTKKNLPAGVVYVEFENSEPVPYALRGGIDRAPNGTLWLARVEIPGVDNAFLMSAPFAQRLDSLPNGE